MLLKMNLMLSSEYRAVHFQKVKEIAIHQAEGEVLAQHIVPYPPGIPVMFRGEVITTYDKIITTLFKPRNKS